MYVCRNIIAFNRRVQFTRYTQYGACAMVISRFQFNLFDRNEIKRTKLIYDTYTICLNLSFFIK